MPYFIKESLIIKFFTKVFNEVKEVYSQSYTKKFVEKCGFILKSSKTAEILNNYVRRNPYFLNSIFFRAIKWIAGIVDKIFGFFHKIFLPLVNGSSVIDEARKIEKFPLVEKLRLLAVFIAAVEFGFSLGSFVKGTLGAVDFNYIIVPIIICFILIESKLWINCIKGSLIYKGIKFLFD